MTNSDYLLKAAIKKVTEKLNDILVEKIEEATNIAQDAPEILKKEFDNIREAQKWWISKSLKSLNEDLLKNNINLEIIEDNQINFFKKFKSNDIAVYWNKIYEPQELKKDKEIIAELEKNKINYKFFKGNVLNEYNEITKNDGTPFKVYSPFWRNAENYYIESVPLKNKSLKKLKKIKNLIKSYYEIS